MTKINTTIYGQVIYANKLVVKEQPLQQTIIVPTRTILHPRLDVIKIIYVQDTPKNVCNMIKANKSYKDILLV